MNFQFDFFLNGDDENHRERPAKNYKARRTVGDDNYRKLFRFSREGVAFLVDNFLPPQYETRGGALNNVQKMETFLRYMSDPGFQVGCYLISIFTFYNCLFLLNRTVLVRISVSHRALFHIQFGQSASPYSQNLISGFTFLKQTRNLNGPNGCGVRNLNSHTLLEQLTVH